MERPDAHLFVADGDATVRDIIRRCASQEQWTCNGASDGIAALKLLKRNRYDLLILDAELPQISGLIVCRHLRKTDQAPVILISANSNEQNRLACFEAGANDCVIKPFYPRELVARAHNLLRLCGRASSAREVISAGKLSIDVVARAVHQDGHQIPMSPKEFDLLLFFSRNTGKAFSRDALLNLVWGQDFFGTDRTVDTHVKNLRQKIAPCQDYLVTVWGYGYKFQPF